jgi:hypothetical protein
MSTTQNIREWYADGDESAYDFMLIVCSKNSDEPFPVYAYVTNYADRIAEYERMGYQILESYDLSVSIDLQIKLKQAFYGPSTPAPDTAT